MSARSRALSLQAVNYVQIGEDAADGVGVGFAVGAEADAGNALRAGGVCGPALSKISEAFAASVLSKVLASSGPEAGRSCGKLTGKRRVPSKLASSTVGKKLTRACA